MAFLSLDKLFSLIRNESPEKEFSNSSLFPASKSNCFSFTKIEKFKPSDVTE